jgi:hypothetical protein
MLSMFCSVRKNSLANESVTKSVRKAKTIP